MEVEPHFDESGPSEQEVGRSESSGKPILSDLDNEIFATASIPDPFTVKSMVKSTEMALKTAAKTAAIAAAKSIGESIRLVPLDETRELEDIDLQHDEVSLIPMEDVDVFDRIFENQNTSCFDITLEKCLSSAKVPEDFIEQFLCGADRTLHTIETTEWMIETTGYSIDIDIDVLLVTDESVKSGSQQSSRMDFSIESNKEPAAIIEIPSKMKRLMILKLFQRRAATKKSGMIVDGCEIPSRENTVKSVESINANDDRKKNSTEAVKRDSIESNKEPAVIIEANDDREKNSTETIKRDSIESNKEPAVITEIPSKMKRPMILKLFQRRAATKKSGMIVDGCEITVEITESINANDDREKNSTEAIKRDSIESNKEPAVIIEANDDQEKNSTEAIKQDSIESNTEPAVIIEANDDREKNSTEAINRDSIELNTEPAVIIEANDDQEKNSTEAVKRDSIESNKEPAVIIEANDDQEKNSTEAIKRDSIESNKEPAVIIEANDDREKNSTETIKRDSIESNKEPAVIIEANDDQEKNSIEAIKRDSIESKKELPVIIEIPSKIKRPMILKLFQRRAATKKSGMIVDGCEIPSRENTVKSIESINANDDREKKSTDAIKREMDNDEDGFECQFLCEADRMFHTVETTEWMKETTEYSIDIDTILVTDESVKSGSIESNKEPAVIIDIPPKLKRLMILKLFQRRAATKKSGMIVDGCEISSRENTVEITESINANDDREKNSTKAIKREMDNNEDGFECILQIKKKVPLEERKEDGPDTTTLSPAKLTVPASDNASNQHVITPSREETRIV